AQFEAVCSQQTRKTGQPFKRDLVMAILFFWRTYLARRGGCVCRYDAIVISRKPFDERECLRTKDHSHRKRESRCLCRDHDRARNPGFDQTRFCRVVAAGSKERARARILYLSLRPYSAKGWHRSVRGPSSRSRRSS